METLTFHNYLDFEIHRGNFAALEHAEVFARGWNKNERCTGEERPHQIICTIRRPSDGMVHVVTA